MLQAHVCGKHSVANVEKPSYLYDATRVNLEHSGCVQHAYSSFNQGNAFLSRWQHPRQHYQHRTLDLCHGFRLCKSACKHIQSNQLATSDWGIFLLFLNIRIERPIVVKKPDITNDSLGEAPFTETLAIPGHARNHSIY